MGVITGSSKNKFVSSEPIFAKIRRDLKTYIGANLVDVGEFPTYVMEVLNKLGITAFKESEDLIEVEDNFIYLPEDLKDIHSVYSLERVSNSSVGYSQGKNIIREEIKCETYQYGGCNYICESDGELICKVTKEMFVGASDPLYFGNPTLLRESPNVRVPYDNKGPWQSFENEYTINDGKLYVNFNGFIYLKYYATPTDLGGCPMIPDIYEIHRVVETYIKYQVLLGLWYNMSVDDIVNKWKKAEADYIEAFAQAQYILKLPSFSSMINMVRNRRTHNMLNYFANQLK